MSMKKRLLKGHVRIKVGIHVAELLMKILELRMYDRKCRWRWDKAIEGRVKKKIATEMGLISGKDTYDQMLATFYLSLTEIEARWFLGAIWLANSLGSRQGRERLDLFANAFERAIVAEVAGSEQLSQLYDEEPSLQFAEEKVLPPRPEATKPQVTQFTSEQLLDELKRRGINLAAEGEADDKEVFSKT
jgi:hypothetical protein